MGGLIPDLRSVVVSGVDPGPRPHTEKGAPMGGQALADTRPPSIKGKGMGGPNSDLSQYFRGSSCDYNFITQENLSPSFRRQ